jgi:hypothetical protein
MSKLVGWHVVFGRKTNPQGCSQRRSGDPSCCFPFLSAAWLVAEGEKTWRLETRTTSHRQRELNLCVRCIYVSVMHSSQKPEERKWTKEAIIITIIMERLLIIPTG